MSRFFIMAALVVAGEMVFGLPFHIARFFRPTYLDVFSFSNTQLGDTFLVYGVTAMLAYFPGGALADAYSARTLIAISLISTALGGLYMATFPGQMGMAILYGYWGVTTVFLLWGAMLRTTREWGSQATQGLAFGTLDGGRGLIAAIVAVVGVLVLKQYLPSDADFVTTEDRQAAMRSIILLYSLVTFLAGVFAWIAIPASSAVSGSVQQSLRGMLAVLQRPVVWAQAGVVIAAYCLFKGTDNYGLYATQVLGMHESDSSALTSYGAWLRPVGAVAAGIIADRIGATRQVGILFGVSTVVMLLWSNLSPDSSVTVFIIANFVISYLAVFGLRGVYFALLGELQTPRHITGAAVGLVSFIGFTPDIFFASIGGRILDANPGIVGHQNYFLFMAACAAFGLLVVVALMSLKQKGLARLWPELKGGAK